MRCLLLLLYLTLNVIFVHCKQHPFGTASSLRQPQQFHAVGILDVAVPPQYREYKRYLPIPSSSSLYTSLHHGDALYIRSLSRNTNQLTSQAYHTVTESRRIKSPAQSPAIQWIKKEILIPDITDLVTVTTLAQIANNAYIEVPHTFDWIDVNGPWNLSSHFGWEKNGLRGHVYASEDNDTIIISLKGTSPAVFLGGGTGGNDKINVCTVAKTF